MANEKQQTKHKFFELIKPNHNFEFVGRMNLLLGISVVLITLSFAMLPINHFWRGHTLKHVPHTADRVDQRLGAAGVDLVPEAVQVAVEGVAEVHLARKVPPVADPHRVRARPQLHPQLEALEVVLHGLAAHCVAVLDYWGFIGAAHVRMPPGAPTALRHNDLVDYMEPRQWQSLQAVVAER